MKRTALTAALLLMTSAALAGDGWTKYRADAYGFQMLVPEGTKLVEREATDGWGGVYAKVEGVELYGLAKLGTQASPEEIERFAVKHTKIPDGKWKKVDEGKGVHGWTWFRVYRASHRGKVLYGAAGTGPKGSYLLFLRTSAADYEAHKADYHSWYQSVVLF